MSVDPRFHGLTNYRFCDEKESSGGEEHHPARSNRGRKYERKNCGNQSPYIGDKPHDHCEYAPQRRARHTDNPKSKTDHASKRRIDCKLRQKKTAEPLPGVVKRCRGALKITSACKPNEPVSEILPLQKNKYYEDSYDAGSR